MHYVVQLLASNMNVIFNNKFLLLLNLILLCNHHAYGQTDIGSACSLSQGSGVCRLINNCPSVYNNLVAGGRPEKVCNYQDRTPIVCCPSGNAANGITTTTRPVWITPSVAASPAASPRADNRPASIMCAQYARSLYTMVRSPALIGGDEQLVNISLVNTAQTLIVGGTKAEPREFPHMVAIGYNMGTSIRWDCGGTLISENFVLTAAHCTSSPQWGTAYWIRVGDLNLRQTNDNAQPQDRRIIQTIRHPNYRAPAQYYDMALLRMQQPVMFTAYVRPACLDVNGNHPPGEKTIATGWGIVDWYDEAGSDDLRKVTIPIVAYRNCASYYTDDSNRLPNGIDDRSQMCAGENGKDTCQGDSGGPLVVYSSTQAYMYDVIGVTSFGQLCGSITPGIYSKVFYYLPWIESVVWPNVG